MPYTTGDMTPKQHMEHIVRNGGRCRRTGKYCNTTDCIIMGTKFRCLHHAAKFRFATNWLDAKRKRGGGNCVSIWWG